MSVKPDSKSTALALIGMLSTGLFAVAADQHCLSVHVTSPDPGFLEQFGASVSILDDWALVGAPLDDQVGVDAGAAYLFQKTPWGWREVMRVLAQDPQPVDRFGRQVSLLPDWIVVSSPGDSTSDACERPSGVIHIFPRSGSEVSDRAQTLCVSGGSDGFGTSLNTSEDRIIVGAQFDDEATNSAGAAYVFRRDPRSGLWSNEQKLMASDAANGDQFGSSVAVQGNWVLAGAHGDGKPFVPGMELDAGSVYFFEFDSSRNQWIERQKLIASDGGLSDSFGSAVAFDGQTAIIGAQGDLPRGSAYVFRNDGVKWVQVQKLVPADTWARNFGNAVDIEGDTIVVGASHSFPFGGLPVAQGAAYVYRFDDDLDQWVQHGPALTALNGSSRAHFGDVVSLHQGTLIVGAPNENTTLSQAGAAYVFQIDPSPADFNCDSAVDSADLGVLLSSWSLPAGTPGCKGAKTCPSDINSDGVVDGVDLGSLLSQWTR